MFRRILAALTATAAMLPAPALSATREWTLLADVSPGQAVGIPTVQEPTTLKDGTISFWSTFFIKDASGEHLRTTRTVAKCDEQLYSLRYVNDRTLDGKMIPGQTVDEAAKPLRFEQAAPDTVIYQILEFACADQDERKANARWIPLPDGLDPLQLVAVMRGRANTAQGW